MLPKDQLQKRKEGIGMMYDNQFDVTPGGGSEVYFACADSGAAGCIRDCSYGCQLSCSDTCTWIQVFKLAD